MQQVLNQDNIYTSTEVRLSIEVLVSQDNKVHRRRNVVWYLVYNQ